ncbi:Two component transcriptional regulator, LuxR family [Alloalcanivorax dieselolei B5]|uniref:Two component transcriptional regulator, LuxR family n=1 Tax=Alcanivorax dieselolei (strain DSM 16502 / CGMCC 1.3690 / MCCC 1A00001 / B-5) TaxID=930169 RepID=K0C6L2_ALCDB|nr:response regulator transcription factor [Alloalcanivorax dieselolei]AFT69139.1 Two component transcriptional regulator, LuxR family [Alloalcanivorax dieselolei B5]GGJ82812.1 DNA-binding response regulator [Alloalcanivorax dieselolei]
MLSALIVEDHEESRDWLAGLLEEAFPDIVVESVGTLAGAEAILSVRSFSLALVDISLPDGCGVDLVKSLNRSAQETYVVMATIHDDDGHLFAALQAGAHGYLLKDQPRARLRSQLQGIARGEPPLSPSVARRMLRHFRRMESSAEEVPDLSERETEVLRLLARGFTRTDIAGALGIAASTVATYTKSIYRKLGVSGRAEAALQAARLGVVNSDH